MNSCADHEKFTYIGNEIPRVDGEELVCGRARYAADHAYDAIKPVYGGCVYVNAASAKLISVDISAATAIPGILAIMTAHDLPAEQTWEKQQILAREHIRFHGEAVALIAAKTLGVLEQAIKAVKIELLPLDAIDSIEASQKAYQLFYEERSDNLVEHSQWQVRKREKRVETARVTSQLSRVYQTQCVEHMYIEPESALVVPDNGSYTVIASTQGPYYVQSAVACALGVKLNRVRVQQCFVGGSFGGKNEGIGMLAARAALLAKRLNQPVYMTMNRDESMRCSSKRHPMLLQYNAALDQHASLIYMKADIASDSGGYGAMTPYVNWRACVHACGCYDIPAVDVHIEGYYSNCSMSGAFRGFSSPQVIFAQESFMDELAERSCLDPIAFRKKNILRKGSRTATNQMIDQQDLPLEALLDRAEHHTDFTQKYNRYARQEHKRFRKGIGLALAYRGCGFGAETADATGAQVFLHKDGSVTLRSALVDVGQGLHTTYVQILADTLGVKIENVHMERADTTALPDGNFTSASRGTFRGGKAVFEAAQRLRNRLIDFAAKQMEKDPKDVCIDQSMVKTSDGKSMSLGELATKAYFAGIDLGQWSWLPSEGVSWDEAKGQGDAYLTYACSVVVAEVEVDTRLGDIRVEHVFACHDVGRAINPTLAKSQISGGIAMGIGMALKESVKFDSGCVKNGSFHDYIIPGSMDVPRMTIQLYENEDPFGPYHAKSLGEACSEAVAASIANAVANAMGKRFYQLPITPEEIVNSEWKE